MLIVTASPIMVYGSCEGGGVTVPLETIEFEEYEYVTELKSKLPLGFPDSSFILTLLNSRFEIDVKFTRVVLSVSYISP